MTGLKRFPYPRLRDERLDDLRSICSKVVLVYYWMMTCSVWALAVMLGISAYKVVIPMFIIGLIATAQWKHHRHELSTRLVLTVAINTTWMMALYVVAELHDGQYMLEVHMFYFINSGLVVAYACWRAVVATLAMALLHHGVLSMIMPSLVWPSDSYQWIHFLNHVGLGAFNCTLGVTIATLISSYLRRLEHQASHDDLTGLLNRRGIQRKLRQALEDKSVTLHLLEMDLDGFKQINDTAGHAVGDELLCEVSRKLTGLAPESASIGRVGGDEFIMLVPHPKAEFVDGLANEVLAWSRRPLFVQGRELRFGVSIGVASTLLGTRDPDELIGEADFALYRAKAAGKNQKQAFSDDLRLQAQERKCVADEIIRGLERGEFVPYFQTQHSADDGRVVGVEALARWNHPSRGTLTPDHFISVAEGISRIGDLDATIMKQAAHHVRDLEQRGLNVGKLSVNVSFARLRDPLLAETALTMPKMRTKLALEIVETVLIDKLSLQDQWMIDRLRERGIQIEIDDFGTGHASLVALTRLQPSRIKIDRELVDPLMDSPEQQLLVRAIVDMATALGVEITAEGVESRSQVTLLREMGVNSLQGFLYSKPMPREQLAEFLFRHAQFARRAM
jgi:diguanylate cyclase (GGDEF)-like protein